MIPPTLAHGPAQGFARTLPGQGPRTRLRLDGPGTEPQIRSALTRAWRLVGQPLIVVVPPHRDPVGDIATQWAAEHALAGIRVEHATTAPSSEPCVVIPADTPAPYCGCVEPPCGRCLDEPTRCGGCASALCPDCGGVVRDALALPAGRAQERRTAVPGGSGDPRAAADVRGRT